MPPSFLKSEVIKPNIRDDEAQDAQRHGERWVLLRAVGDKKAW